jgi:hypothetical protein
VIYDQNIKYLLFKLVKKRYVIYADQTIIDQLLSHLVLFLFRTLLFRLRNNNNYYSQHHATVKIKDKLVSVTTSGWILYELVYGDSRAAARECEMRASQAWCGLSPSREMTNVLIVCGRWPANDIFIARREGIHTYIQRED